MATGIQNIINNVLGDGARSTKFECLINFIIPELYSEVKNIITLTKTSQFPGKQHEIIDFKFKGRSIPLRGQTKYEQTWSCTFYLEQDHKLKKAFDSWIESIDQKHNYYKPSKNVALAQQANNENYATDLKIYQQDFDGAFNTAEYILKNCFPKSISQVEVSYENNAQIIEYTVEFAYTHYELNVIKAKGGSFVDQQKEKIYGELKEFVNDIKSTVTDGLKNGLKNVLPAEKITEATKQNKDQTQFDPTKMKDSTK